MASKKKIVIDTAAGINDAHSLLMALSCPEVDVVAITTVGGHAPATQVAKNVLRVLALAQVSNIPIYVGRDSKDIKALDIQVFGSDGFGDCPDDSVPNEHLIQKDPAYKALLKYSKEFDGELNLVCLGPLTNIAKALEKDTEFGTRMKTCYIAGGNFNGRGNVTVCAEFNFLCDPPAADAVISNMRCHILLACWEICKENALSWDTFKEWRKIESKSSSFMKKIEANYVEGLQALNTKSYYITNELLMAAVVRPDVITDSSHVFAAVETKGVYTTGQMIVDWELMLKKYPNVELITKVDPPKLQAVLFNAMKRL